MEAGLDAVCDTGREHGSNITALPFSPRDRALLLHLEEIWLGHRMRVYELVPHLQSYGHAQREIEHCYLLPETEAQQLAEIAALRLPWPRYTSPHYPQ